MAIPPIFKFRNIKVRLTTNQPSFIYGVNTYNQSYPDSTLANQISPVDVTAVILTVQISNLITDPVSNLINVSAMVQNSPTLTFNASTARFLVQDYPLIQYNAFDPLNGNLVLATNDQLWVQCSVPNYCDIVVSLLEIANATAS